MSTIPYTNQIPLQQTNAPPPPPPQRYMNSRRRGGVFGDSQGNLYNQKHFYHRNIYYNRNYQPQRYYNGYNGGGYSIISRSTPRQGRFYQRPIRRINQNRPESHFNRPRSRSNQQGMSQLRQQRTRGPSLPSDFNLVTTITTNISPDALPQCESFRNNTTQPFVVNQNKQENQQQNRRQ
ncbi:unnamed protein product [Rotaria sordida]|uniref:Uncharacterized protein n=1 Tax=Rotaria sordida TaxID=392033 RepID=A0A819JZU2_9BILA|nr:unnamed protein product [Rotaria sordida]